MSAPDGGATEGPATAAPAPSGPNAPFHPAGTVVVVTGGASGIGAALARAVHLGGAAAVVVADLGGDRVLDAARAIAASGDEPGGSVVGVELDVADPRATAALVEDVVARHGRLDLWCANAGIATGAGVEADPATWQRAWEVNVAAHTHAARVLVPLWQESGRGHLLVTASAAGLLTNLGDAPYSATKHAAVGFAEWLAITHGGDGVGVSCLCPQGVRTPLLFPDMADAAGLTGAGSALSGDADPTEHLAARAVHDQRLLEPDDVAEVALAALAEGRFLILPHAEVAGYEQARAADHDRWITGMRRLQARLSG